MLSPGAVGTPTYPTYGFPAVASPSAAYSNASPSAPVTAASAPIGTTLVNGAAASLQEAPGQFQSVVSVRLPVNRTVPAAQQMLARLLLNGSRQNKTFLDQCRAEGIDAKVEIHDDALMLRVTGPVGQEAKLAQTAATLLAPPPFDPVSFGQVQTNYVTELQNPFDEPAAPLVEGLFAKLMGQGHPYTAHRPTLIAAAQSMTPQALYQLYTGILAAPQNFAWQCISAKPTAEQAATLNQAIGNARLYAQPGYARPLPPSPPVQPIQGRQPDLFVPVPGATRAHVGRIWRAPEMNHPDYTAFSLLRRSLSDMNGPFYRILRTERGLTYSPRVSYRDTPQGSFFTAVCDVSKSNATATMQAYDDVIARILSTPVKQENLQTMKKTALRSVRQFAQDATTLMQMNDERVALGMPPKSPAEMEADIQAVTLPQIQRIAWQVLNPQTATMISGISG